MQDSIDIIYIYINILYYKGLWRLIVAHMFLLASLCSFESILTFWCLLCSLPWVAGWTATTAASLPMVRPAEASALTKESQCHPLPKVANSQTSSISNSALGDCMNPAGNRLGILENGSPVVCAEIRQWEDVHHLGTRDARTSWFASTDLRGESATGRVGSDQSAWPLNS